MQVPTTRVSVSQKPQLATPPSQQPQERTPKPVEVAVPKPKQDKPIQPPPTIPKEQGRGELTNLANSTPLLTSPQKPCQKSEKLKPIMPVKPKIPLSYEAKGKGKVDDPQPPKKTVTQNCQAELVASAVKAKTSRKTKVFQPKYPSMNNRKWQTKQIFVPKDQLDGCKNKELRWVPRSTSSSHQASGCTSTRKASNEESFSRHFPKKQQKPNAFNAKSKRQKKKHSRRPKTKTSALAFSPRFKQMWIPKELLQAQGYYDGQTTIWVPRTHKPKPQQPQRASKEYRWIPKSTLKAQGYYEGQEYLWLPKGKPILRQAQWTQQKPISQTEIAINKTTTMSRQESVKQVWFPKVLTKESNVVTVSYSSAN